MSTKSKIPTTFPAKGWKVVAIGDRIQDGDLWETGQRAMFIGAKVEHKTIKLYRRNTKLTKTAS